MSQQLTRTVCKTASNCVCKKPGMTIRFRDTLSHIRDYRRTEPKPGESRVDFDNREKQDWYQKANTIEGVCWISFVIGGTIIGGLGGLYYNATQNKYYDEPYFHFGIGTHTGFVAGGSLAYIYPHPIALGGLAVVGLYAYNIPKISKIMREINNKQ